MGSFNDMIVKNTFMKGIIMHQEFIDKAGEYIFQEDTLEKADIIFVPGNGYPQMAEAAAELYKRGYAPYILPSGKHSIITGEFSGVLAKSEIYDGNYETEWEFLQDVLIKNGVPKEAILREDASTFTYENAIFSKNVTDAANLKIKKAIMCCKNYHARRACLYYQLLYPETEFMVKAVCVDGIRKENWQQTEAGVDAVTGEITRIIKQFTLML